MKSFKNISNLRLSRVIKNTIVTSITPLPLQFTSSTLTISSYTGDEIYKNGTYNISSSSMYNTIDFANYLPFNLNPPDGWVSANNSYDVLTSLSTTNIQTTLSNTTKIIGEWVGIQLPYSVIISSYELMVRNVDIAGPTKNTGPTIFSLLGSNTGVDGSWIEINNQNISSSVWSANAFIPTRFEITTTIPSFSYFRLVVTNAGTQYPYLGIKHNKIDTEHTIRWYLMIS